jgi:hypothetical protein
VRHQVPVRADYIAQLQAEMVRELPTRSRREKDAFTALDVREKAWRFMNWQSRRIHPHPRQINNQWLRRPTRRAGQQARR